MSHKTSIAFIILAHSFPSLLRRIIDRLTYDNRSFFIHIDSRADLAQFTKDLASVRAPVTFVKREATPWGSIGIAKATLNGLNAVVNSNEEFDYVVLLSGQTYPVKSNDRMNRFFSQISGKSLLHFHGIPHPDWADTNGGLDRINRYYFSFRGYERFYPPIMSPSGLKGRVLNSAFRLRFPMRRSFPRGMIPYGGSQWWCITADVAKYVVDFCVEHPEYLKYHEHTFISDEIFFHSIILNAPNQRLQWDIINDFSVYMDWSLGYCKTLGLDDYQSIASSGRLFARKFDEITSSEVLDKIDSTLLVDQPVRG